MSKQLDPKEILEALRPSLTGLRPAEPMLEAALQATGSPLGVLEGFTSANETNGTTVWTGKGFNIVELPNRNMVVPPNTPKFQVMMQAFKENLTFTRFKGNAPAPNRGNSQDDIDIHALQYFQSIDDIATGQGIHAETGMWLTIPDPLFHPVPMLARMGVLPHGNTLLCQGFQIGDHFMNVPPQFNVADTTPFTLDAAGRRVNDTSQGYLQVILNTPRPAGITPAIVANPNLLLQQHLAKTTVLEMDVLVLSAQPIAGIDDIDGVFAQVGARGTMGNIPFDVKNANANSMTCIFWLEKVRIDGNPKPFLQLQYSQTVILDFEVLSTSGVPTPIKWPHVSVATLREPGAPPL